MFSLRVAILLALSSRFAVCEYSVTLPYTVEDQSAESKSPDGDVENVSPCPDTANTPVIEPTPAPTLITADQSNSVPTADQESNVEQPPRKPRKIFGPWALDRNSENGFFIKHFRQYNYYYPNGQRLNVPVESTCLTGTDELSLSEGIPVASSISMTNNNGKVSVKTSSTPTVQYNLPGVASYVPNNGFNYVQFPPATRPIKPVYGKVPIIDEVPVTNEEPPTPSSSPPESSAEQPEPTPDDEPAAPEPSEDNSNEEITTYESEPNDFGQIRMTVIKNNKHPNFKSQQISISSRSHSKSRLPGYQSKQEVGMASASASSSNSPPLPGYGAPINFDGTTTNFGTENRLTLGYNPYFQSQIYGVSPMFPPQLPLPMPGYQNTMLGGPTAAASQFYQPNAFQYFNPVVTWPNILPPPPSTAFDYPNMSPSYSIIL